MKIKWTGLGKGKKLICVDFIPRPCYSLTMSNNKTIYPTLYHKTSKGSINSWEVWAEDDAVYTKWGKMDGKQQVSKKTVEPKNVGKANETNVVEQAKFEAEALWTHKLTRKYSETIEESKETVFLPMLAEKFEDRKKFLTKSDYPVDMQPKLNGVRSIAHWKDGKVHLLTRGGKTWLLPHISKELEGVLGKDMFLDGELYIHGMALQDINKLVRRSKTLHPEAYKVEFHVYDCGSTTEPDQLIWAYRKRLLVNFFEDNPNLTKIIHVIDVACSSEDEVYAKQNEFIANGYEGAVVRLQNGVYRLGYRSKDLLKVKSFVDDEFKVVGFTSGRGKFENLVIFICETKSGDDTFEVVPRGTAEERNAMLVEGDKYIGQMLNVRYAELTTKNKPHCPVGICFRLPEDM